MPPSGKNKVQSTRRDPLLSNGDAVGWESSNGSGGWRVGRCGHVLILSMPLLTAALILTFLYILLSNLDANTTIQDLTISSALTSFEPYYEIASLACLASLLSFVVTITRNIQFSVFLTRKSQSNNGAGNGWLRPLNALAAIVNILAFIGFMVLIIYKIDQEEPPNAQFLHFVGASTFFVGSSIYALVHVYLLFQQTQYPLYAKLVFSLVAVAMTVTSSLFGIRLDQGTEYEWFAVAFAAVHLGLFGILFHIDPVDDELVEFFSCGCCRRRGHQ